MVRLIEELTLLLLGLKDLYFFEPQKRLFHQACHAAHKLLHIDIELTQLVACHTNNECEGRRNQQN